MFEGTIPEERGEHIAGEHIVELKLDEFTWEAITQESATMGVAADDLVAFSVLYYLADVDAGRISRRITQSPYPRLRAVGSGALVESHPEN